MKFLITDLEDIPWVRHGFFTRDADPSHVAQTLDVNVVSAKQVHGIKTLTVEAPWDAKKPPEADALVTSQKHLGVAIVTADCAPVLFASRKDKVVGAAHAGWKGALNGVLESTIAAMTDQGVNPADIYAAVGPCIGPLSYEVSADFKNPFLAQDADNAKFFTEAEKKGHLMFDLPAYVIHRLKVAGLGAVYNTRQDTLTNEGAFCSYRRATLRGEKDYGRQLSVIAIK